MYVWGVGKGGGGVTLKLKHLGEKVLEKLPSFKDFLHFVEDFSSFSFLLFSFFPCHVVGQAGRDREMAGKMHHMLALNFPSWPLQAIIYTVPIPRSASPT